MKELFGSKIEIRESGKNEVVIEVLKAEDLIGVLKVLKSHTGLECKCIIDVTCVDWVRGLEMVYELVSVRYNRRVRVKCKIGNEVESVSSLFSGVNWLEREVYDMFGVYFVKHPDLRRLLTDYGFKGKALRKDFSGGYELKYDEEKKAVVSYERKVV